MCPSLGTARRNGAAWDELAARHDEIGERLKVNRPSTVWQRLHDDEGLQASLASFRRYALATLPDAYGSRPSITVRRDDGTWDGRLRRYLLPSLLIIDDFAMREFTAQQLTMLYELIDERSRAGSMNP